MFTIHAINESLGPSRIIQDNREMLTTYVASSARIDVEHKEQVILAKFAP